MACNCNEICKDYENVGYFSTKSLNVKRCTICQFAYENMIANRCPCCNNLLRTKPHRPTKKRKIVMEIGVKRI